jgi:hypothetical protein
MTLWTANRETSPRRREKKCDAEAGAFGPDFTGVLIGQSELLPIAGGSTASRYAHSNEPSWGNKGFGRVLNQVLLTLVAATALAFAPQAAFGQHGGGGHVGGGGGGHFGGSGSSHYSAHGYAPATGRRAGRSPSGAAMRPVTPLMNFGRGNPIVVSGGATPSSFARPAGPGAPQHVTIGFPPADGANGFAVPGSTVADAAGWRPIARVRDGGVLSFSGQGHEIWQNNSNGSDRRPGSSNALLESRPAGGQRPHPFPPRRFHGGFYGPGYGYGYGWAGFYPWGFGLGLYFDGICDPWWSFDCDTDGYPGYGYYGPYAPELYSGSSGSDESAAAGSEGPQDSTVLYLNDGTSFAVSDYWVADYKLHYVTDDGRENVIDLNEIDVQRTVDENAARGVDFTLKPAPGSAQR